MVGSKLVLMLLNHVWNADLSLAQRNVCLLAEKCDIIRLVSNSAQIILQRKVQSK